MRFWDRITGGAAEVYVELDRRMYMPGEAIHVKASVSAEGEFEAKSALITLRGEEEVRFEVPRYDDEGNQTGTEDQSSRQETIEVEQRIRGPIRLGEGQQEQFDVELRIPPHAPPTYKGANAQHYYRLTVALDVAWSADPRESVDVMIGMGRPED